MRLSVLFAALLASGAATQQTTFRPTPTAGPGTTSTSLPELVSRLPRCALQCFSSAARDINCAPSNFSCLCANSGDLIAKVGPCAFLGCSSDDVSRKPFPLLLPPPYFAAALLLGRKSSHALTFAVPSS